MEHQQDFVYCLAPSPNFEQDQLIFAAKQSGLYRSIDGGQTWMDAYASLELTAPLPTIFHAVTISEANTLVFACVEGNILRSLDGGVTWAVVELSSPPPLVTSLLISPSFPDDGFLLAGTMQDGILRSTNRGATWSSWNFGLYDPNINALSISLNFDNDQTVLAGTQSGVFISINGGRSWSDLDFPIDFAPALCLAVDQKSIIYVGTENEGLYVSHDQGKTWDQLISGSVEQIFVSNDGEILILCEGEIQFSKDFGKSWEKQSGSEADSAISCLAAPSGISSDHPIFVGLSNGKVIRI